MDVKTKTKIPVETGWGIRGGRKESSRGSKFNCDIFDTL
jgi:hypothetical protein